MEQREQVETLLTTDEHLSWVALTDPANLEKAEFRQLIYEHFYDYFSLPFDDSTHLRCALDHLYGMAKLRATEDNLLLPVEEFHMVGGSKQFLGIFDQIRRVATAATGRCAGSNPRRDWRGQGNDRSRRAPALAPARGPFITWQILHRKHDVYQRVHPSVQPLILLWDEVDDSEMLS